MYPSEADKQTLEKLSNSFKKIKEPTASLDDDLAYVRAGLHNVADIASSLITRPDKDLTLPPPKKVENEVLVSLLERVVKSSEQQGQLLKLISQQLGPIFDHIGRLVEEEEPPTEDIETVKAPSDQECVVGPVQRIRPMPETLEALLRRYEEQEMWQGKYASVERPISQGIINQEIPFGIKGRTLLVRTDQDITIRINDRFHDEISISSLENLMIVGGLKPRMVIESIYVSTLLPFDRGRTVANVRILVFG